VAVDLLHQSRHHWIVLRTQPCTRRPQRVSPWTRCRFVFFHPESSEVKQTDVGAQERVNSSTCRSFVCPQTINNLPP